MSESYIASFKSDLFLCFLCNKYKPIAVIKSVLVKSELGERDVCLECYEKASTVGLSREAKIESK